MNPTLLLLLLVTARWATAQPSPPSSFSYIDPDKSPYQQNFNAATAILIVLIVSAFFFLAFFSVYFRRCTFRHRNSASVLPTSATAGRPRGGLDPSVIETFPTLTYSAVTTLKIGKESLECAVCLSEFAEHENLRMLPKCCHVFHPECIDTWLASHVTCPVCRANLSVVVPTPETTTSTADNNNGIDSSSTNVVDHQDDVAIDFTDLTRVGRSHSMSHVSGVDRFTLRLPEHVRREIVREGSLRRSASMAVSFGRGGGEGSGRRGYRGVWGGLSDRWASGILTRVSTWRGGEAAGEGSVTKKDPSLRGGRMFNCISGGGGSTSTSTCDGNVTTS